MKEFLSIKEVAEYWDVDYKTVYRLVQQAEIPAGKVGGVYRIPRQEVVAYFERQRQALAREAARAQETDSATVKCGRCLKLLPPSQFAGICESPDCDRPICDTCWEEDRHHHCRDHIPSAEARLREARHRLARGEISLLLSSQEARQREFAYVSRLEAKLHAADGFPNPLGGKPLRVSDWTAIRTRFLELERFRETAPDYVERAAPHLVPNSPRLTYWLASNLTLEIEVYSDLPTHLKQGFVTEPTTFKELFELLSRASSRAEETESLLLLGLAATAGWDEEAAAFVQGNATGQRSFYHRLLMPVLVDLADDRLIFSRTDERLFEVAPLLSADMDLDAVQRMMEMVENLIRSGRSGVLQSEMVERGGVPQEIVVIAFDRLEASGDYEIREIDKKERMISKRTF